MSFAVYNDSFQLFTNTVDGKSVPSDLSDYQITASQGSRNPWHSGQVGRQGYVVVTHGKAPTSPAQAGRGAPGDSIGAYPVPWINPKFQVRYWSIANYLNASPYPVVENGQSPDEVFGGTADYLTTLRDGYYTVVSSLPADKPSPRSLRASGATWIPTSTAQPTAPEFQLLRNMLSQQRLYPEGFTFIPPPASPSDNIPPATVEQHMGAYYPQTAQCAVQIFETFGWDGCRLFG